MTDLCYNCGVCHFPHPCKQALQQCTLCHNFGHSFGFCPLGPIKVDPNFKMWGMCHNCDQWHLPHSCEVPLHLCKHCGNRGHIEVFCPVLPAIRASRDLIIKAQPTSNKRQRTTSTGADGSSFQVPQYEVAPSEEMIRKIKYEAAKQVMSLTERGFPPAQILEFMSPFPTRLMLPPVNTLMATHHHTMPKTGGQGYGQSYDFKSEVPVTGEERTDQTYEFYHEVPAPNTAFRAVGFTSPGPQGSLPQPPIGSSQSASENQVTLQNIRPDHQHGSQPVHENEVGYASFGTTIAVQASDSAQTYSKANDNLEGSQSTTMAEKGEDHKSFQDYVLTTESRQASLTVPAGADSGVNMSSIGHVDESTKINQPDMLVPVQEARDHDSTPRTTKGKPYVWCDDCQKERNSCQHIKAAAKVNNRTLVEELRARLPYTPPPPQAAPTGYVVVERGGA